MKNKSKGFKYAGTALLAVAAVDGVHSSFSHFKKIKGSKPIKLTTVEDLIKNHGSRD